MWSRVPPEQGRTRLSDIILALIGVSLLGTVGLMAGIALVGRSLAP